jgi:hypothetical protein
MEYKVVVISSQAQYLQSIKCPCSRKKRESVDHVTLFRFAESSVLELGTKCPSAMLDGLVRVDIFIVEGKCYVNEFESLEALWQPQSEERHLTATRKMIAHWKMKLNHLSLL